MPEKISDDGVKYPLPSHCWLCGRFGRGARRYANRRCDHCGCQWFERLPGAPRVVGQLDLVDLLMPKLDLAKWRMQPDKWYADQFNQLIDHSRAHVPCPA